jgi:hypothetical protein
VAGHHQGTESEDRRQGVDEDGAWDGSGVPAGTEEDLGGALGWPSPSQASESQMSNVAPAHSFIDKRASRRRAA